MPRTHAYGLIDLFALVAKLLAPFVDPLRAEFARRGEGATGGEAACETPATTIPPEPAAAVVCETDEVPAVCETAAVVAPEPVELTSPADAVADHVRGVTKMVDACPPAVAGDTDTAGPLFVRKKAGGQWRYHTAEPDAAGPKFRRVPAGRRVRYEPVG